MTDAPFRHRSPEVRLRYLRRMTDDVGLVQHAVYGAPRRQEGYATDDNARALVVVTREHNRFPSDLTQRLADIYLAFLFHGLDENGRFLTFMSYDRRWLDTEFSDDTQGRCLWAAAEVAASRFPEGTRLVGRELFERGMRVLDQMVFARGLALSLIGLEIMAAAQSDKGYRDHAARAADILLGLFERCRSPEWVWFEDTMTYCNARLPHGLISAWRATGDRRYLETAETSLGFLDRMTTRDGLFVPIGTMGWANRAGRRALYDQQPVEAGNMVEACTAAYRATGKEEYRAMARKAFDWFLGRNTLGKPLADLEEGSCCDGLHRDSRNLNRGGEATVSLLLALQCLRALEEGADPRSPVAPRDAEPGGPEP